MKKYWWVAAAIILLTAFIFYKGCNQPDESVIIATVVRENTQSYRRQKDAECRQTVLDKANMITDSIMLNRARMTIMTQDSIIVPLKPSRPIEPRVKSRLDTAKVKPLFE